MAVIAILGANGQIGRGLASVLARNPAHRLRLVARRPDALRDLATIARPGLDAITPLDRFEDEAYDAVVNAAGDGERAKQIALGADLFRITETLDNRVTDHVRRHPRTAYFFMSTGAVYGFGTPWPVRRNAVFPWPVNAPDPANFYPLAKLVAEAKHRAHRDLAIYDIRIFGYFSRFIPLGGSFFLSELADAVVKGTRFRTSPVDMVRDYIDHEELAGLIETFLVSPPANGAYDIYSAAPVGKLELLEQVSRQFGLGVDYTPVPESSPARLAKPTAPSDCRQAAAAGHKPRRSSLQIVTEELRALLAAPR